MMIFRRGAAVALALLSMLPGAAPATAFETAAEQAILVDVDTGAVLLDKNSDRPMFPASMTKIMTAYLTFERLAEGSLKLTDTFRVSEKAWRKGGSKMFVEVGSDVSIEDLLRGVIVQSGNDASIVLGEGIAGSEEAFAALMTDRAHELGMRATNFTNATGWPDEQHVTTARDLARLSVAIVEDFPQYYGYFGETHFSYNGIDQSNRNPLLYLDVGSDGLKTGHTEASGYGLAASAARDGRRLVLVVNGLASERERSTESARLIGWGFGGFDNHELFRAGEVVETLPVWMGAAAAVPVTLVDDLTVTLPRTGRGDLDVAVRFIGPLAAPVPADAEVGRLVVTAPGLPTVERPLVTAAAVERLGFVDRQFWRLKMMLAGPLAAAQ